MLNKKLFLYLATYPLSLLSRWMPKQKNLWVFGSWGGVQYNDNSKYFFKYVCKNHPEVRAVWLTRSKKICEELNSEGYECYLMYSMRGIYIGIFAYVGIISRAKNEDLPLYISAYSTKIVQLWHGTPLKKLGRDNKYLVPSNASFPVRKIKEALTRFFFPQLANNYAIFIAASEHVGKLLESAYGHWMQPNAIRVTGYPRNDNLSIDVSPEKRSLRGIYLPTFRDWDRNSSSLFSSYDFDIAKLENALESLGVTLHMKLHPEATLSHETALKINQSSCISLVNYSDIYEYLGEYDFLITDYSSIFFDFLILDKPIIYAPFDLEKYVGSRGIYFNYDDITPGFKAMNWNEVIHGIHLIAAQQDDFKEARDKVNALVNSYKDSSSCHRVFMQVINL